MTCEKPLRIKKPVSYFGCTFSSTSSHPGAQIQISGADTPQVLFNNCTFLRKAGESTRPFIEVEAGAKVVFVGCRFIGLSGGTETDNSEEGMIEVVPGVSEAGYSLYSSGTATVVIFVAVGHAFSVGDSAYVTGSTISGINGTHVVSSVTAGRISIPLDTSAITISGFTNGGAGGTSRFTTSAAHGLVAGDVVHLSKGLSVASATDVTGDQVVSAVGGATQFDIAIIPGTISDTSGQAFKGGFGQTTLGVLPHGADAVQLVGCMRHPIGAAYAVADSDTYVTKTGCI